MADSFLSTIEEIKTLRAQLEGDGGKLVLTNGAFDILHVGHVRYLKEAAALGDRLVVAINSDESVRELKGSGRPINSVFERAEMLRALECVDRVVEFRERRATGVIEAINPHVYTKGGDYTADSLIDEEKDLLDRLGCEIRILSLVPGKSTSSTLSKLSGNEEKRAKIAILGSGKGSNAQAILSAAESGALGGEVAVVMSDVADSGILDIARGFDVPALFVDPGTQKAGQLTDAALKEIGDRLNSYGVDLVVLAGFMRVIREPLLSVFQGRILNLHPSLLPEFPGLNPVAKALDANVRETGCTVHLVDAGIDSGKILRQESLPVYPDDSVESLTARIHEIEHQIYPEVIAGQLAKLV
ncbi:MAG: phosphoribosylglycinamide formyltransferase [Verrucomicrobiales bacterium]|nr:phosphoribosylglycinamide formyltransferase [Verrucomicrobiales bacterium]